MGKKLTRKALEMLRKLSQKAAKDAEEAAEEGDTDAEGTDDADAERRLDSHGDCDTALADYAACELNTPYNMGEAGTSWLFWANTGSETASINSVSQLVLPGEEVEDAGSFFPKATFALFAILYALIA